MVNQHTKRTKTQNKANHRAEPHDDSLAVNLDGECVGGLIEFVRFEHAAQMSHKPQECEAIQS